MCAYMHACVCVHLRIRVCVYVCVHVHVSMHVCTYVYVYVHVSVYMSAYSRCLIFVLDGSLNKERICVHKYMYAFMCKYPYVYEYVYVCVCMYVCMYAYICMFIQHPDQGILPETEEVVFQAGLTTQLFRL